MAVGDITAARSAAKAEIGSQLLGALNSEMPQPVDAVETDEIDGYQEPVDEAVEEPVDQVDDDNEEYVDLPDSIDIKEFAELTGVEPEYLYNNMTMTLRNGETVSLGAWKDQQENAPAFNQQQQEFAEKQRQFDARIALEEQYGNPIRSHQTAMQDLQERYSRVNWEAQINEHGDAAKLAKVQMQQQYSQVESELNKLKGEYDQAMNGYHSQISEQTTRDVLTYHPEWNDPQVAQAAISEIHSNLSDILTIDELTGALSTMGVKALKLFERAATGGKVGNINAKKVRRAAKSLKGGRRISAKQQRNMQQAKKIKAAKSGTRKERVAAAAELISNAGGF